MIINSFLLQFPLHNMEFLLKVPFDIKNSPLKVSFFQKIGTLKYPKGDF